MAAAPVPAQRTNWRRLSAIRRLVGCICVSPIPQLRNAYTLIPVPAEQDASILWHRRTAPSTSTRSSSPRLRSVSPSASAPRFARRAARRRNRLPPERLLIEQFGYSRAIVREALRMLEEEGLISLHLAGPMAGPSSASLAPSDW